MRAAAEAAGAREGSVRAVVVGVDGGGSRTRAVVVDEAGRELARGEAQGFVVTLDAAEAAAAAVISAVSAASERAGMDLPAGALWAGLSGAGREPARRAVLDRLCAANLARSVHVGTDVEVAFHDAFPDGPGVMLIAGTGSIAWARDERGRMGRVGGWGTHLGDGGSGYAVGMAALRRVVLAEDRRGHSTELCARIMAQLGLADPRELIDWAARAGKGDVAALAPLVARTADEDDATAAAVLAEAVAELAAHVETILDTMGPWSRTPGLALCGGLIWRGGPLRARLERALVGCPVEILRRELDPPLGAARLALGALSGASG